MTAHIEHTTAGGHQPTGRVRAHPGRVDRHAVQARHCVQAVDHVAGAWGPGVALGGRDDRDVRVVGHRGFGADPAVGRLGEQLGQVVGQAGHHHLRLGVTEAHVVLDELGAVRGEHEPGVQDAAVVDAPAPQLGERRADEAVHHRGEDVVGDDRDRRVGTHPTGVGAGVAVADPLEVLCRGQQHRPFSVAHRQDAQLRAAEALLDHERAPGVAEGHPGQVVAHRVAGLGERLGDHDALAGGQAVGLDHERRGERVEHGVGRLDRVEGPVAGGGDAGRGDQLLHPRLGPLEPGPVGPGAEDPPARRPQAVGQAVDQRHLGPDHEQVGLELLRRRRDRAGDAGVAGGHHHLGVPSEHVGQRVLPSSAADDADLHGGSSSRRPGPASARRRWRAGDRPRTTPRR